MRVTEVYILLLMPGSATKRRKRKMVNNVIQTMIMFTATMAMTPYSTRVAKI